ncbi:myrosinase 1-like [Cylas formicarius]|uniref:myrosinase 1-like n=1 Tax=Cylas formicarius TaxID=197179 RepID=UPI00295867A4|nr:myrosinase 1-like [Cylas formicarius]
MKCDACFLVSFRYKMTALQVLLLCFIAGSQALLDTRAFPPDFMLGVATSAYQIEGAWNEDGKGENVFDFFYHTQGNETGDVACDSYHKWEEDIQNVVDLGAQFYRFSISWTRILPDGTLGNINQKGIDYYMNIIKALKSNNIEPVVTIFHYDEPLHISKLGGFLNDAIVDYFGDFARLLYSTFGQYVKYWLTINEPSIICLYGYGSEGFAPALGVIGDGIYRCSYTLLKAHARAYHIYDEEFRATQNGKVSIAMEGPWYDPSDPSSAFDQEASERALQFREGWFANPIFVGDWHQILKDRIGNRSQQEGLARSRLPSFTEDEIAYVKGTSDYYSFNVYGTVNTTWIPDEEIGEASYYSDLGVNVTDVFDDPAGIRKFLNWINDRYNPGEIMITENGKENGGGLEDDDRIQYIQGYLSSILDAIYEDYVNVIGYSAWSLMDNFEWGTYSRKFGLIQVDFGSPNRTRTWKKAAYWYKNVTASRQL